MPILDFRIMRVPLADDDLNATAPEAVLAALAEHRRIREAEADAHHALGVAQAAFTAAERADVEAGAEALRTGSVDPGPTNVTAARLAIEEAKRRAAIADRAARDTGQALARAIEGPDQSSWLERVDALVQETRADLDQLLTQLEPTMARLRDLIAAAQWLRFFPDTPERRGSRLAWIDTDTARIGVNAIREALRSVDLIRERQARNLTITRGSRGSMPTRPASA